MRTSLDQSEGRTGPAGMNGRRPRPIVEKLNGEACRCCGGRYYYLVFRVKSREGERARLAARCSRCYEQRDLFSVEQLVRDLNRISAERGCAPVG